MTVLSCKYGKCQQRRWWCVMVLHNLLQEVRSETCKWKGKNKSRIEKRGRQENECWEEKKSKIPEVNATITILKAKYPEFLGCPRHLKYFSNQNISFGHVRLASITYELHALLLFGVGSTCNHFNFKCFTLLLGTQ